MSGIHCNEKEDSPHRIPCQHTEDVCQNCLKKVKTSIEDSPLPKIVICDGKPTNAREEGILLDSYFVMLQVALTYFAAKKFLKKVFKYPD